MKCTLCPVALAALGALAGGSLVALTQPDASSTPHKSNAQPGRRAGNDPEHPGTNMAQPGPGAKAMEEVARQVQQAAATGPNHAFFEKWVGAWDTTTRVVMTPGAPAQETRGHCEFSWLMEGRWLQERAQGTMSGLPLNGFGLFGYDTFNKRFVSCRVDNLSTAMVTSTGSLDESGKVLTMFGQMDDPTTGERGKTVRFQTTILDDDTHTLVIDQVQYGRPFTVVEVTYTRAK